MNHISFTFIQLGLCATLGVFITASTKALADQVPPGDCALINQAIQALPAEGGTVTLSEGLYTCTKPVVIDRDGVTLLGQGRSKTLIKAADGKPIPVVIIGSSKNVQPNKNSIPYPDHVTKNIALHDLAIDGNYHSHKQPGSVECYDPVNDTSLNCGSDSGFLIRNNGLTIRRAEHVQINAIETRGAYSGGIVLEKKNVDIVMDGFSSYGNYFDGFAGYETTASLFTHFDVSRNQFSGISVDWGFEGNTFDGGTLNDNGDNGVFSSDVGHNMYMNLELNNNHDLGIYFAGVFGSGNTPVPGTCDGNQLLAIKVSGPKAGVVVNSPCQDTVLDHVYVTQTQLNCKWTFPGSSVKILNSTCTDGGKVIRDLVQ